MVPGLNLVPALLTEHEHQCMYVKNLLTGPEPVIDRGLRGGSRDRKARCGTEPVISGLTKPSIGPFSPGRPAPSSYPGQKMNGAPNGAQG